MSILDKALQRMDTCWEAEQDVRLTMGEDYSFITKDEGMWEGAFREDKMKVKHTFDLISPIVNQMVSDQRATRIGVSCIPVNSSATTELADTRSGIIRAIQENSDASDHYARAFEEAAICGLGGLRAKVQYCSDDAWEQELTIECIPSAFSCMFIDPASQKPDGSDSHFGFVIHEYTEEQFVRDFGDIDSIDDFPNNVYEWKDTDTNRVRVAEYYYKEPVTKRIVLMSDGTTYDLTKVDEQELMDSGLEVVKEREVKTFKVMKAIICGNKVLEQPEETPFNNIPIVPVYGISRFINGKRYSFGIVRKAKDPIRLINWVRSRNIEEAAFAPAKKVAMPKKSIQENAADVANLTDPSKPILGYTPDETAPNAGLPTVIGGSQINEGMENLAASTQAILKEIVGVFGGQIDPSQTQLSGQAIGMLQGRSDNGTFIYQDNLMVAVERIGELCNEAIPSVYSGERQVYILAEDGSRRTEDINQQGNGGIINDLAIGKYKISIEAGASFSTQRREVSEKLMQLVSADPTMMPIAGDILVKNLDLGDGGALAKRLRKQAIASGIIDQNEMTEQEIQEMQSQMQAQTQQQQQQDQIAQLDMQLTIQQRQLELAKIQAEIDEISSKAALNSEKVNSERTKQEKDVVETRMAMAKPEDTTVIL